jgi:hypothetical protein
MIYVCEDGGIVGFKFEGEHEIDPKNDYPIFEEYYDQFFELQNVNGNLRLKDPRGKTFWDIFEEYELPVEGETEEQRQTSKLEELESEISLLKQLIQGKRE